MPIQHGSKKGALTITAQAPPRSTIDPPMRYPRGARLPEISMKPRRIQIDLPSHRVAGRSSLAAILAGALLLSTAAIADDTVSDGGAGTWQSHKYTFQFMGFTSTYSCDGLADKLRIVLLAAGARADVKSSPGACASGFGRPDKFARADLTFYTLAPADASAGTGAVQGVWRPVVFTARQPRQLGLGDCELMEQFRQQVLPMFTTRDVAANTTCVPHQESGSNIDLKFEAFTAVPTKKHPTAATGGAS
jgi:hypothetical protein